MTISEAQLTSWSNRGAVKGSEDTYASIKSALDAYRWPTRPRYDVYLQGSYRNHTNTRGNSDVDVVVELDSTFYPDTSALSQPDLLRYKQASSSATYDWFAFRTDIYTALCNYFGKERVKLGKKTVKVTTPYLPADVVVCSLHRTFLSYTAYNSSDYIEGMTFYVSSENRWVVNYPKQHYQNGNSKTGQTRERYKPTVRVVKNMRYWLEDNRKLAPDVASSYFIECLLYNAPNSLYGMTYQQTIPGILNWIRQLDNEAMGQLICQNGVLRLCGSAHEQWPTAKVQTLNRALIDMWNNWE